MIMLFSRDIHAQNRRSSKGNQLKFERNQMWYKADYLGYEGLAEYVISNLFDYSTLHEEEYVKYDLEQITYNDQIFRACSSHDFTDGWQLITLERLFIQGYGRGLNQVVYAIENHTERLKTMVQLVEQITGLRDFGAYMAKLMTIDTFFLNEDRHAHNLAVLTKDLQVFKLCPIFDNGASLLSDTMLDYPMGRDPLEMIPLARPKTFCESFDEQLDIAESICGETLKFHFQYNDVKALLDKAVIYSEDTRKRVLDLIMHQRHKYTYLFR